MKLIENTPIELYNHKLGQYWVKREDLSCPAPGPPFSKVRGLMKVLEKEKAAGTKVIGYTETSISMAGIGVAWGCKCLGMKAVIFDPQYKKTPGLLKLHRREWKRSGAVFEPVTATRHKINYYIGKRILREKYPDSVMLPLGLPFRETIEETVAEIEKSDVHKFNTIVLCIGSGTICAGILLGFKSKKIIGVMVTTGNIKRKREKILNKAGLYNDGFFGTKINFRIEDPGWQYTDRCTIPIPFPCHPYYDAKAYLWMIQNLKQLSKPVLFWNIGAMIT